MTRRMRATCPLCIEARTQEGMKHCHGICDKIKPLEEFHNDKSQPDGKTANCAECNRTSVNAYAEHRREEDLLWNRAYFLEYQASHRDYFNDYQNRWLASSSVTSQRFKEQQAEWRAENPDKVAGYAMVRRARKSNAANVEFVERMAVAERDEWTCMAEVCYCPDGRAIDPDAPFELEDGTRNPWYLNIDHIDGLAGQGDHTYDNVRATHHRCNLKRKKPRGNSASGGAQ